MIPELLAPAGSVDALRAAYLAGADAVYIGGERFGARAYADNPDDAQLMECIALAHRLDKKLYLTVNTLVKEEEMEELVQWLAPFYRAGLDAAIVQDLGVLRVLRVVFPDLPLHASTQMAVTGARGAKLLEEAGVRRVIPARELDLSELRAIRETTDLEIEAFVHGALCYSVSGRCLMSSLIGGRSGNRGRCAGICRLPMQVRADGRSQNDEGSAYPLNMKDLCALDELPAMAEAGVVSLKIEGRMKRPAYTAGVVAVYRRYLDLLRDHPTDYRVDEADRERLADLFNRDGFTEGYFRQEKGRQMIAIENRKQTESRSARAQRMYREIDSQLAAEDAKRALQKTVNGHACLSVGQPARLDLSFRVNGETLLVSAQGEEVLPAQRRPLSELQIREQLEKTGNAAYRFEKLEIDAEEGIFLPLSALNALRRAAFGKAEESLCARFARETAAEYVAEPEASPRERRPEMVVCVSTREQAEALSEIPEAETVGLPLRLRGESCVKTALRLQEAGKKLRLLLPALVRGNRAASLEKRILSTEKELGGKEAIDSYMAFDLEGLALLRGMGEGRRIVADAGIYAMNRAAVKAWREQGCRVTLPLEANAAELGRLGAAEAEMIVYGRAPMMVSTQCLRRTVGRCDGKSGTAELEDRKGMRFPVACFCDFCYNIVYNALPTDLGGDLPAVSALAPAAIRLDLTVEDGGETREVVRRFAAGLSGVTAAPAGAFTRGHFRRGAE